MGNPIVFFDTETGGTKAYPHTNDKGNRLLCSPIIQIAAIVVDRETLQPYQDGAFEVKVQFKPEQADDEALALNHYDPEIWEKEALPAPMAAGRFASFLDRFKCLPKVSKRGKTYWVAQGAGHNARKFDMELLMAWCKALDVFLPLDYLVMDTLDLAIAWTTMQGIRVGDHEALKGFKLGELADYFKIQVEGEAHDALVDVQTCIEVYRNIRSHFGSRRIHDLECALNTISFDFDPDVVAGPPCGPAMLEMIKSLGIGHKECLPAWRNGKEDGHAAMPA